MHQENFTKDYSDREKLTSEFVCSCDQSKRLVVDLMYVQPFPKDWLGFFGPA